MTTGWRKRQIEAMEQALEALPELPPPECQTEAEKIAFAFGWFKAMEAQRKEPEQEPKCGAIIEVFGKDWQLDYISLPVGKHKLYTQQYTYTSPPQHALMAQHYKEMYDELKTKPWVGLTLADKEEYLAQDFGGNRLDAMDWSARKLKEKNGYA